MRIIFSQVSESQTPKITEMKSLKLFLKWHVHLATKDICERPAIEKFC